MIQIRSLRQESYLVTFERMQQFTQTRSSETPDEVWLIEHLPVFTQGQAGKPEHIIASGNIPVIQSDRGGQVTYHGPGQLLFYILLDLKRKKYSIRDVIQKLQHMIIDYLKDHGVNAHLKEGAPGVYVNNEKIAALGLRVKKGCTYHGLSLNVDMDLSPFQRIHPCGFSDLTVTQTSALGISHSPVSCSAALLPYFCHYFGYTESQYIE